jgi:hypothetical protein
MGRTIRGIRADSPWDHSRWSTKTVRTTSTAPLNTDGPYPFLGRSVGNSYRAYSPRHPGGWSAKLSQPKALSSIDRTTHAHEQAMNWTNSSPCRLSAPTRRTVRQVRTDARVASRECWRSLASPLRLHLRWQRQECSRHSQVSLPSLHL